MTVQVRQWVAISDMQWIFPFWFSPWFFPSFSPVYRPFEVISNPVSSFGIIIFPTNCGCNSRRSVGGKQLDLLVSDFYLSGKKQQHGMKLACMGTLRWTCISSGWMHSRWSGVLKTEKHCSFLSYILNTTSCIADFSENNFGVSFYKGMLLCKTYFPAGTVSQVANLVF